MTVREEITIDEVITRITECLEGSLDCDDIIQVANDMLEDKYTYGEDGLVTVEKETDHG